MSTIPVTPLQELPPCHTRGESPQGYDPKIHDCSHLCPDKFTCLPEAIEGKLVKLELSCDREVQAVLNGGLKYTDAIGRMKQRRSLQDAGKELPEKLLPTWEGLLDAVGSEEDVVEEPEAPVYDEEEESLGPADAELNEIEEQDDEDDEEGKPMVDSDATDEEEVAAASERETAPETPKSKRPPKKQKLAAKLPDHTTIGRGGVVIWQQSTDSPAIKVGKVCEVKGEGWGWWSIDNADESPKWYDTRDQALTALLKSPAAKRALKPPKKATKATTGARVANGKANWPTMKNGKPLPSPKKLNEEEMRNALTAIQGKLGTNIELDYGMKLVRKKRDGDVIAAITPHGFEYTIADTTALKGAGLEKPKQIFGSLSSVAMWHERRMVSGNDFFNVGKHTCTEVRDKKGKVLDRKGGL